MTYKSPKESEDKESDFHIDEINKVLDRADDYWRYLSEFAYGHQLSSAKNYLWLAVTFLTALAAIYTKFIEKNFLVSFIYCLAETFFIMSCICSALSLILGVIVLSSRWFIIPEPHPMQADKSEYMIIRAFNHSPNSQEYFDNLKAWSIFFDRSITTHLVLIKRKGELLHWQNLLILFSFAFGAISLFIFLCLN